MLFTIELAGVENFRLCKDRSWRTLNRDVCLHENDFTTDDPAEVTMLSPYETEIDIDGNHWLIGPTSGRIGEILDGDSHVFRRVYPSHQPSIDQLREVIRTGDDAVHNSLILNVYGQFELRQRPPYDPFANDPSVVARCETFSAGNDYVGPSAALDDNHVQNSFVTLFAAWTEHLRTGNTQSYFDYVPPMTIGDSEAALAELENNWEPQY
jgi:hypothetical protein